MNILLIEMEGIKGHHVSSYLRSVIRVLLTKRIKIFLLTTREIKQNSFYKYIKKNTKIIYVSKVRYPENKNYYNFLKFQIKNYLLIKKIIKKINLKYKIQHIYFNTLDFFDKPLSIFGLPFKNTKCSGIYLNPKFNINDNLWNITNIKKKLYEILFFNILKFENVERIFIIDPITFNYLKRKKFKFKNKISFIKDIGTANHINKISFTKIECRKMLKIKKKNYVILLYGSIRENKSINELLNAFCSIKNKEDITILVAGLQDEDAKKKFNTFFLEKNSFKKNFVFINKYINDKLEKIIFKASDITWVGYSRNFFGSSGVLFLSSQNYIPAIGSNHGSLGWYLHKYKIGFAGDLTNTGKIVKIFEKHMSKRNKFIFNFEKANKNRNFDNFGQNIVNKLASSGLIG